MKSKDPFYIYLIKKYEKLAPQRIPEMKDYVKNLYYEVIIDKKKERHCIIIKVYSKHTGFYHGVIKQGAFVDVLNKMNDYANFFFCFKGVVEGCREQTSFVKKVKNEPDIMKRISIKYK